MWCKHLANKESNITNINFLFCAYSVCKSMFCCLDLVTNACFRKYVRCSSRYIYTPCSSTWNKFPLCSRSMPDSIIWVTLVISGRPIRMAVKLPLRFTHSNRGHVTPYWKWQAGILWVCWVLCFMGFCARRRKGLVYHRQSKGNTFSVYQDPLPPNIV